MWDPVTNTTNVNITSEDLSKLQTISISNFNNNKNNVSKISTIGASHVPLVTNTALDKSNMTPADLLQFLPTGSENNNNKMQLPHCSNGINGSFGQGGNDIKRITDSEGNLILPFTLPFSMVNTMPQTSRNINHSQAEFITNISSTQLNHMSTNIPSETTYKRILPLPTENIIAESSFSRTPSNETNLHAGDCVPSSLPRGDVLGNIMLQSGIVNNTCAGNDHLSSSMYSNVSNQHHVRHHHRSKLNNTEHYSERSAQNDYYDQSIEIEDQNEPSIIIGIADPTHEDIDDNSNLPDIIQSLTRTKNELNKSSASSTVVNIDESESGVTRSSLDTASGVKNVHGCINDEYQNLPVNALDVSHNSEDSTLSFLCLNTGKTVHSKSALSSSNYTNFDCKTRDLLLNERVSGLHGMSAEEDNRLGSSTSHDNLLSRKDAISGVTPHSNNYPEEGMVAGTSTICKQSNIRVSGAHQTYDTKIPTKTKQERSIFDDSCSSFESPLQNRLVATSDVDGSTLRPVLPTTTTPHLLVTPTKQAMQDFANVTLGFSPFRTPLRSSGISSFAGTPGRTSLLKSNTVTSRPSSSASHSSSTMNTPIKIVHSTKLCNTLVKNEPSPSNNITQFDYNDQAIKISARNSSPGTMNKRSTELNSLLCLKASLTPPPATRSQNNPHLRTPLRSLHKHTSMTQQVEDEGGYSPIESNCASDIINVTFENINSEPMGALVLSEDSDRGGNSTEGEEEIANEQPIMSEEYDTGPVTQIVLHERSNSQLVEDESSSAHISENGNTFLLVGTDAMSYNSDVIVADDDPVVELTDHETATKNDVNITSTYCSHRVWSTTEVQRSADYSVDQSIATSSVSTTTFSEVTDSGRFSVNRKHKKRKNRRLSHKSRVKDTDLDSVLSNSCARSEDGASFDDVSVISGRSSQQSHINGKKGKRISRRRSRKKKIISSTKSAAITNNIELLFSSVIAQVLLDGEVDENAENEVDFASEDFFSTFIRDFEKQIVSTVCLESESFLSIESSSCMKLHLKNGSSERVNTSNESVNTENCDNNVGTVHALSNISDVSNDYITLYDETQTVNNSNEKYFEKTDTSHYSKRRKKKNSKRGRKTSKRDVNGNDNNAEKFISSPKICRHITGTSRSRNTPENMSSISKKRSNCNTDIESEKSYSSHGQKKKRRRTSSKSSVRTSDVKRAKDEHRMSLEGTRSVNPLCLIVGDLLKQLCPLLSEDDQLQQRTAALDIMTCTANTNKKNVTSNNRSESGDRYSSSCGGGGGGGGGGLGGGHTPSGEGSGSGIGATGDDGGDDNRKNNNNKKMRYSNEHNPEDDEGDVDNGDDNSDDDGDTKGKRIPSGREAEAGLSTPPRSRTPPPTEGATPPRQHHKSPVHILPRVGSSGVVSPFKKFVSPILRKYKRMSPAKARPSVVPILPKVTCIMLRARIKS